MDRAQNILNKLKLLGWEAIRVNDWCVVYKDKNGKYGYVDTTIPEINMEARYNSLKVLNHFVIGNTQSIGNRVKDEIMIRGSYKDILSRNKSVRLCNILGDEETTRVVAMRYNDRGVAYLINSEGNKRKIEYNNAISSNLTLINCDGRYDVFREGAMMLSNGDIVTKHELLLRVDKHLNRVGTDGEMRL